MENNLWFLTEERPKKEVLNTIFQKFAKDYGFAAFVDTIRIFPILKDNKFTFTYEVTGFRCNKVLASNPQRRGNDGIQRLWRLRLQERQASGGPQRRHD